MYTAITVAKKLSIVFLLLSTVLFFSCKKDGNKSENTITYTRGSTGNVWEASKVEGYIINDSLILRGSKKDGSAIAIIVANSYEGIYTIDLTQPQALVIINDDGSKESTTNFLAVEGSVTIDQNDTKNKKVKGYFNIQAAKLNSITSRENITGTFTAKYKSL